jgi:hypothetical protein
MNLSRLKIENRIKVSMKQRIALILAILTAFQVFALPPPHLAVPTGDETTVPVKPPIPVKEVVWCGLDYSMVKMIGGEHFDYGFNVPDLIFPGMLDKWNQLFLDEQIDDVAIDLKRRVMIDTDGVKANNQKAGTSQIILQPSDKDTIENTHITPDLIANEVKSYDLKHTNGLALVFIVDRFVCSFKRSLMGNNVAYIRDSGGAVYVVFFDIATRNVISSKREVNGISSGSSFRNFWFGPIKDAADTLRKYQNLKTDY